MTDTPSALTVARFLQENPSFFSEHAELFAALTVPHPNQARAISLGERQIMTLRERQKEMELRLATLSHQATFNQGVAEKITRWCADLLTVTEPTALPGQIISGLKQIFDVPEVALRMWGLANPDSALDTAVTDQDKTFAQGLAAPYCGPNQALAVARWLQIDAASLAIVPLTRSIDDGEPTVIGLLLLASDERDRFTPDMGTTFLETIGRLASAALSRLPRQDAT